ncbi:MAG: hypothetical protein ACOQNV_01285 [Mycoplasmoidaceae bacterium]
MTKKKWLIFLPNLLCITGLSSISLAACGKQESVEKLSFTVADSSMESDNIHASISIDWTPSDHSIIFSSFSFKFVNGTKSAKNVRALGKDGDRPFDLYLEFDEVEEDITDGILSFHYNDSTTSSEDDANVANIHITKTPEVEYRFSIDPSQMDTARVAYIELCWEPWKPSEEALTFYDWRFTYKGNKTASVIPQSSPDGEQDLKLSFNEDIVGVDIADGSLSFHYKDNLSLQEGDYNVNNIKITSFCKEIDYNFSVEGSRMLEKRTTNINLNWTPDDRDLSFDNFAFNYDNNTKSASIEIIDNISGQQKLKLTFEDDMDTEDITDGVLSFDYKDNSSLQEGNVIVEQIKIQKYEEIVLHPNFFLEYAKMVSETEAEVMLAWTLYKKENIELIISGAQFRYDCGDRLYQSAHISLGRSGVGYQCFSLTFNHKITKDDVINGLLSFYFKAEGQIDRTAKSINNIVIKKFVPTIQFDFVVPSSSMSNLRSSTIELNWTPDDKSLDLTNFKFKYANGRKEARIGSTSTSTSGSQTLNLLFTEDISVTDIVDGVLSFHYENERASQKGDAEVDNIYIHKYVEK